MNMKFCIKCGNKLPIDSSFCPKCGAEVKTDFSKEGTKSNEEEPKYCKDCGNILDFTKEGEYRGDYVKFYKCNFCNKTYAKKLGGNYEF